jgi:hypothetical protein
MRASGPDLQEDAIAARFHACTHVIDQRCAAADSASLFARVRILLFARSAKCKVKTVMVSSFIVFDEVDLKR